MSTKPVMVTGAAGLIGHRICQMLIERGTRVVATDLHQPNHADFDIEMCDLADLDAVERLTSQGLDAIIHCGGFSGPMVGTSTPFRLLEVNVGGTINLLELGRRHGIRRFVFASSGTVMGSTTGDLVDEENTPHPANLYAASKAGCEHLVTSYSEHFTDGAVSLRLAWVYGPRRTTDCVIRDMILDAQSNRRTELPYGDGFPRQFMYVDDAAAAMIAALDAPGRPPRTVYNATGDDYSTLDEVAAIVSNIVPEADISLQPGTAPLDVIQARFDVSAIEQDLKFVPQVPLTEGIARYAAWLAQT